MDRFAFSRALGGDARYVQNLDDTFRSWREHLYSTVIVHFTKAQLINLEPKLLRQLPIWANADDGARRTYEVFEYCLRPICFQEREPLLATRHNYEARCLPPFI